MFERCAGQTFVGQNFARKEMKTVQNQSNVTKVSFLLIQSQDLPWIVIFPCMIQGRHGTKKTINNGRISKAKIETGKKELTNKHSWQQEVIIHQQWI